MDKKSRSGRIGLKFQEAILKKVSQIFGKDYKLSLPSDESHGIDGYIGEKPVSIKPDTYKIKRALNETIDVKFIYYKKSKDGISIDIEEFVKSN